MNFIVFERTIKNCSIVYIPVRADITVIRKNLVPVHLQW
jgi:hypothetical protein